MHIIRVVYAHNFRGSSNSLLRIPCPHDIPPSFVTAQFFLVWSSSASRPMKKSASFLCCCVITIMRLNHHSLKSYRERHFKNHEYNNGYNNNNQARISKIKILGGRNFALVRWWAMMQKAGCHELALIRNTTDLDVIKQWKKWFSPLKLRFWCDSTM